MTEYLLDANVLIEWLNGRVRAATLLQRLEASGAILAVNAISIGETWSGLDVEDAARADKLISAFDYWVMEFEVGRLAGELRYRHRQKGRALTITDTLLAAHAISRGATLVTGNIRDFPTPELKLLRME